MPGRSHRLTSRRHAIWALPILLLLSFTAWASGPRYVTGPPFFTGAAGVPIGWKQSNLLYYTDPGDLSATVPHADADALVAQAAAVWNVPVASITLSQGGALAEHVSGQNVYLDTAGMVFPADLYSANAAAIPLAIVYDTDGSVIDTLLGAGSSDPLECGQNGVVEEVDGFDPAGYITHALLVLNGRCTGPAPEQQMELRYQLMRGFGRVLGLAWSQTNDNVFTGVPTPSNSQALHWPIMHPIDILCGPYPYQCLPNPFQLRPDDLASMVALYPIASGTKPSPGKQVSLQAANRAEGTVSFPTGQGMAGVNVLVRRGFSSGTDEDWLEASAVTGSAFQRAGSSPFVSNDPSPLGSMGALDPSAMGRYTIPYIPLQEGATAQTIKTSTEAINPLYTGPYSIGPYAAGIVEPSGKSATPQSTLYLPEFGAASVDFLVPDAAASCGDGTDGTAAAPIQVPATGWWRGVLCGYGHAAYDTLAVQPGRTFTVEITALDEQGLATTAKALPVIGLFTPDDLPGSLPSLGSTPAAFNASAVGTTNLSAPTGAFSSITLGIADQRGDGRPDFNYQARLFYADSIAPQTVGAAGGQVVISGMGFRAGNQVLINGVPAAVASWTANQLTLTTPTFGNSGATDKTAVDVVVTDGGTGATSVMSGALTYDTSPVLPESLRLLKAPTGTVFSGDIASSALAVQVLAGDGVTPVAGASIDFSAALGAVQFQACGTTTCTLKTDATGVASTLILPLSPGLVNLHAAYGAQSQSAAFTVEKRASSMQILGAPSGNAPTGQAASPGFSIRLFGADGAGIPGSAITFSVLTGGAMYGGCASPVCTVRTEASGYAAIWVTPTAPGPITLQAAGGGISQQVQFLGTDGGNRMDLIEAPAATSVFGAPSKSFIVAIMHRDGLGPAFGERVTLSAPDGLVFYGCGQPVCQITTNSLGAAGSALNILRPGTYTIQATYGAQVQTDTFTVTPPMLHLQIVSAPSGEVPLGIVAKSSFAAQLLQPDGVTPVSGAEITLVGAEGDVLLDACMRATCQLKGDANGIVSTRVIPLRAGIITLSAVSASLLQTASFQSVGGVETLRVLSRPTLAGALVGDPQMLTVQLILGDGVTPAVGRGVNFIAGSNSFAFSNCTYGVCRVFTDANGQASMAGVVIAPGPISVQIVGDSLTETVAFLAFPKASVMHLLSAPTPGSPVGTIALQPFAIQLFLSDGVTPAGGQNVTFSVTGGVASLQSCLGASTCVVKTDPFGRAASFVTPLAPGSITVMARSDLSSQAASFTAQETVGTMLILSVPSDGSLVGTAASLPLSVQLTAADGVTPRAGVPVTVAVTNAAARLLACGSASCTLITDGRGIVSTSVAPLFPGEVGLSVTEVQPGQADLAARFASFRADDQIGGMLSFDALEAETYLAAGESATIGLHGNATQSGLGVGGQKVLWRASPELNLSALQTLTDGAGSTSLRVVATPLGAGARADATACTLAEVCTDFAVIGVSAQSFHVFLLGDSQQQATSGSALAPLTALVLDSQGHPVVSAPVNVFQTVAARTTDCPARGRCPAMAVLTSKVALTSTDQAGLISVPPFVVSGTATETRIVLSSGLQGFMSAVVTSSP